MAKKFGSYILSEQEISAISDPFFKKGIVIEFARKQFEVGLVFIMAGIHKVWQMLLIIIYPILSFFEGNT